MSTIAPLTPLKNVLQLFGFIFGSRALREVLLWFPKTYKAVATITSAAEAAATTEKKPLPPGMPHGAILGTTKCGVVGYNCNYKNNPDVDDVKQSGGRPYDYTNFLNGQFTGMKWQCVEFARRYWLIHHNVILPAVQWAAHIWRMKYVNLKRNNRYFTVPLQMLPNGGVDKPSVGDLIIYKSTPNQRVGHVAVIVEILDNCIRVGEQNNDNDQFWVGGYYSEEIPMTVESTENGTTYTCKNPDPDMEMEGWVRLRLDQEHPRDKWVRPAPEVTIDGNYDKKTCTLLQALVGGFADGDHGGLTNSNLRNFLHVHGRPEDKPVDVSVAELILSLRKFLIAHLPVCGTQDVKYTTTLADLLSQPTDLPNSVCLTCTKAAPGCADTVKASEASVKCLTTTLLQGFLNNIRVAEDIPDAMEQCL